MTLKLNEVTAGPPLDIRGNDNVHGMSFGGQERSDKTQADLMDVNELNFLRHISEWRR